MGFGFNLFGLPLLILATIVLLFYSLVKKSSSALKLLGVLWIGVVLIFVLGAVLDNYRTPIRLTHQQVIGGYRIDTGFFPGPNARWQFEHYRFLITDNDSICFFYVDEKKMVHQRFKLGIKYCFGPPVLWSIINDTSQNIFESGPILYRSHNRFYYVFKSKKIGNMFFRHVSK
jgi:hypothetical protein